MVFNVFLFHYRYLENFKCNSRATLKVLGGPYEVPGPDVAQACSEHINKYIKIFITILVSIHFEILTNFFNIHMDVK
jgi:hypothetical protein